PGRAWASGGPRGGIWGGGGAYLALAWSPPAGHDRGPVRKAVERAGRGVVVAEVDVTKAADVEALVARAVRELGGMHIVVANAGIARKVQLADLDDAAWNKVLDVNLNGVWRCFRAALPHMQRAGYGRLIATSSVAGTVSAWPLHSHYTASKAGLVGLVQSLAVEFGANGLTANAVAPGVIRTPQALDPVNSLGPEGIKAVARKIPAGRVGSPEDVAYVFLFLASAEAAYVNGQLLVVDGARSLAGLD